MPGRARGRSWLGTWAIPTLAAGVCDLALCAVVAGGAAGVSIQRLGMARRSWLGRRQRLGRRLDPRDRWLERVRATRAQLVRARRGGRATLGNRDQAAGGTAVTHCLIAMPYAVEVGSDPAVVVEQACETRGIRHPTPSDPRASWAGIRWIERHHRVRAVGAGGHRTRHGANRHPRCHRRGAASPLKLTLPTRALHARGECP